MPKIKMPRATQSLRAFWETGAAAGQEPRMAAQEVRDNGARAPAGIFPPSCRMPTCALPKLAHLVVVSVIVLLTPVSTAAGAPRGRGKNGDGLR